jgi:hypothetical protein
MVEVFIALLLVVVDVGWRSDLMQEEEFCPRPVLYQDVSSKTVEAMTYVDR